MKKIILAILTLCSAIVAKAQSTDQPSATLQHGDEVKVFYGINALRSALNDATDNDVITLSAGTFNAADITKPISIYGAGFEINEETGTDITNINGEVHIYKDVHIEGVYFANNTYNSDLTNSTFIKCFLQEWIANTNLTNVTFQECIFQRGIGFENYVATNLLVRNSKLSWIVNYDASSSVLVDHCLVTGATRGDYNNTGLYTNCIFTYNSSTDYQYTSAGGTMKSCIYVSEGYLHPQATVIDCILVEKAEIFADGENAGYTADRTFELKQPETWIGTDGTQIGIRGGDGWGKTPATPVVKNLQLSVEGTTLNVNYESEVR